MSVKGTLHNQPNIAVVSVLYKKGLPFLKDYLRSLKKQVFKGFDLLLFNRDIEGKLFKELFGVLNDYSVNYKIINVGGGGLATTWNRVLKHLSALSYAKYVFADIDDYFDARRVGMLNKWLDKYPLVFHDLNLYFNGTGRIERNYFSKHVPDLIDWRYIVDKNCIGFGNSGIRKELLPRLAIPPALKVIDWFVFFNVLRRPGRKAAFIRRGLTFYRQYGNNLAAITELDDKRIRAALVVKYEQYKQLYRRYDSLFFKNKMIIARRLLKSRDFRRYAQHMRQEHLGKSHLWWEYAQV